MHSRFISTLLVLLIPSLGPAQEKSERYALLVGIQKYDSKDFGDLSYTEDDVEELAKILVEVGYKAENVVVMTIPRGMKDAKLMPSVKAIRNQLAALTAKCKKDDVLLVGLTGHGVQPKNGKQYFCCHQAKLDDETTLLSIDEVYETLGKSDAGLKLVMVDACRNNANKSVRPKLDGFESVTSGSPPKGVLAFFSCSEGEMSWEPSELQHGLYFYYIIEALKGRADWDNDGQVHWEELVRLINKEVNSFAVSRLKKVQRPHFRGDVNVQVALAVLPGKYDPAREKNAADKTSEFLLLENDFRNEKVGGPPRGWDGDSFAILEDKEKRRCLESTKKSGTQEILLPKVSLKGDFFIETEFLLDNYSRGYVSHELDIHLLGRRDSRVKVSVNGLGDVQLGTNQVRASTKFTAIKLNRLRLTREGDVFRVSINDEPVAGGKLELNGDELESIRFGLSGGLLQYHRLNTTAKIYSVKVGKITTSVASTPDNTPADDPRTLLAQKFNRDPIGGLPRGWSGDAFSILEDTESRRCLEINRKGGTWFLALPKMRLEGDFYVELEALLDYYSKNYPMHSIEVRLLGRRGTRVSTTFTGVGTVQQGNNQERDASRFERGKINRFRISREGDLYRVTVNGEALVGSKFDLGGDELESIRIGMTGGHLQYHQLNTLAKIYSVNVGYLGKPPADRTPPKPDNSYEPNLDAVSVGDLPADWKSLGGGVNLMNSDGFKFLGFTREGKGNDAVALPPLTLPKEFYIESFFMLPHDDHFVEYVLGAKAKGKNRPAELVIGFSGDGKFNLARSSKPVDISKTGFVRRGLNELRLLRVRDRYTFTLNDREIYSASDRNFPGEISSLVLSMGRTKDAKDTPRIFHVRVVSLDEQPLLSPKEK